MTLLAMLVTAQAASAKTVARPGSLTLPFSTLQLGVEANLGQTVSAQERDRIAYRYAYLAGGVNTGQGWAKYASAVPVYIAASAAAGIVPIFTYSQLAQSAPARSAPSECAAELENLKVGSTMAAYFNDLKLFFQEAAGATGRVILQVEPDLWGCIEQASAGPGAVAPSTGSASSVSAAVAASGVSDVRAFANTAAGFAQATVALRNRYAPTVLLGYHDSYWGSGIDLQLNHPSASQVQAMAGDDSAFYRSLGARFNVIFSETHDRDAGYSQTVDGDAGAHWWTAVDFQHLGSYLRAMHRALELPVMIWQIPVGTTGMNDTPGHYADNQVQTLLGTGPAARSLRRSYAADGVAALLFGPSVASDTPVGNALLSTIASWDRLAPLRLS